jgi:D-threo-aldose 1-dehydrogenase
MPARMSSKPLGQTSLTVTPLCMGGSLLGSMPAVFGYEYSEEQAIATVSAVFRSPINFLDTAAGYSDGESERRVGLAIQRAGGLPSDFVLASKADPDPVTGDFSGDQVSRCAEASLGRLGVTSLALYYLHDPENISFEFAMAHGGPVERLRQLKEEGLVGAIGVAGGPIDLLERYIRTDAFDVVLTHNRFTLLERTAEPLIALARDRGIGVVNAAPFGGGILAKGSKVTTNYAYRPASAAMLDQLRSIEQLCTHFDTELAAAALQFSLRDSRISATVATMSSPGRIEETLRLADVDIPAAFWVALDTVVTP